MLAAKEKYALQHPASFLPTPPTPMVLSTGGQSQGDWMNRLLQEKTNHTEDLQYTPPEWDNLPPGALADLKGSWKPNMKQRHQLIHKGLGWWSENEFHLRFGQTLESFLIESCLTLKHGVWLNTNEVYNFRNLLTHGLEMAQEVNALQEKLDAISTSVAHILHENGAALTELACCMLLAQLACGPGLIWAGRKEDGVAKLCWASTKQILDTFPREDLEILLWSLAEIVKGALTTSPVCVSVVAVVLKGLEPHRQEMDQLLKINSVIKLRGPWSRVGLGLYNGLYRCKIYPSDSPIFEARAARMIVWATGFERLGLELKHDQRTETQRHLDFRSAHFVDSHNSDWLIVESVFINDTDCNLASRDDEQPNGHGSDRVRSGEDDGPAFTSKRFS